MSPRSWRVRAQDILKAIAEIESFTDHASAELFLKDVKAVRAVTACLTVIGEATNHIPKSIKDKYPEIGWDQVRGMRNRIAHEYFSVDDAVIWKTAKERLPVFKTQIQKILDATGDESF